MKPLFFLTYSVIKKEIINDYFFILLSKNFFGLVKMTFGLVDVGYSLPDGQAVKLIFFAPWMVRTCFHISNRPWIRCDAYTK